MLPPESYLGSDPPHQHVGTQTTEHPAGPWRRHLWPLALHSMDGCRQGPRGQGVTLTSGSRCLSSFSRLPFWVTCARTCALAGPSAHLLLWVRGPWPPALPPLQRGMPFTLGHAGLLPASWPRPPSTLLRPAFAWSSVPFPTPVVMPRSPTQDSHACAHLVRRPGPG